MIDLKCGDSFAGCKIIDLCGQGGYGTVYLAEDATGKRVAVKIISTNKKEQELNGIKSYMPVSQRSPYLLSVYHVGVEQNELFLVMEAADSLANSKCYLPDTLARRLQISGRIPPEEALDIIKKIAEAVQLMHESNLIHRDIKPDNVVFVDGQPKLSDPGLVCSTDHSITLAGTLGFLPPECFYGTESNSIQSDIYALGKLFYCMITGEVPGRFPYLPRDLSATLCRKLLPLLMKSCNTQKKKRYSTVAEFLHNLPKRIPRPGVFQRFSENFRIWRLMHNFLWNTILLLFVAGIGLSGFLYWKYQKNAEEQRQKIVVAESQKRAFEKKINAEKDQLSLQLERLLGTAAGKVQIKKYTSLPSNPLEAVKLCDKFTSELNQLALQAAGKNNQIADAFNRAAMKRAFLKSPLGSFLTAKQKENLQNEQKQDEKNNLHKFGTTLKLEQKYYPDSSGIFEFAYIPPGEFISPFTKRKSRIDYPFWVAPAKLTVRQFSRMCRFLPPNSKDQDATAVRFLWNDIIYGCRNANEMFQIVAPLPPGYIVRPLTNEEWDYCLSQCKNGTNAFGLTGMEDDINEFVSSGKARYGDAVLARSGKNKRSLLNVVYYQSFLKNFGIRIAIAPGSEDFYDRALHQGTPRHLVYNGKHYEYFGHLCANFSRDDAERLCRLLGGRLAAPDSPELLEAINRAASPAINYYTCVASDFKNGKWYWSNGKPIQNAPPAPGKNQYFALSGKKFQLTSTTRYLGFICEWTEEEYANRKNWKERIKFWPEKQRRIFRVNGKDYVFFRFFVSYPHLCRRYAELLGGKLAELDEEGLKEAVCEKIKDFDDKPTLLGGYWHHNKYFWNTSKKEITEPLPLVGQLIDTAPSLSVPAIQKGDYCSIQLPEQFLVEFPTPDSKQK